VRRKGASCRLQSWRPPEGARGERLDIGRRCRVDATPVARDLDGYWVIGAERANEEIVGSGEERACFRVLTAPAVERREVVEHLSEGWVIATGRSLEVGQRGPVVRLGLGVALE
jgi:hypothetical protein